MSIRVSITNAEIDVLTDLAEGDSPNYPGDRRYDTLMTFLNKVTAADKRPWTDERSAESVRRNEDSVG